MFEREAVQKVLVYCHVERSETSQWSNTIEIPHSVRNGSWFGFFLDSLYRGGLYSTLTIKMRHYREAIVLVFFPENRYIIVACELEGAW